MGNAAPSLDSAAGSLLRTPAAELLGVGAVDDADGRAGSGVRHDFRRHPEAQAEMFEDRGDLRAREITALSGDPSARGAHGIAVVFGEREEGNALGRPLYLRKHRITEPRATLEIIVDEEPRKAGIDPYHKLIDRNRWDNTVPVRRN